MGSALTQNATAFNQNEDQIRKSKIKSQTVWQYDAASGKGPGEVIEATGVRLSAVSYDEEGKLLEQITYGPDGSIREKLNMVYNDSGYVDEASISSYLEALHQVMDQRILYVYDENYRLTSVTSYDPDGKENLRIEYTYDSEGLVREGLTYGMDSLINVRAVYTYDEEGKIIDIIAYNNTQGTVTLHSKLYYQADGWEIIMYGVDGTEMNRTKNIYGITGQVKEVINYDSNDRITSKTSNTYDSEGRLIETTASIPSADMTTKTTTTYDSNGNILEQITYNKLNDPVKVVKYVFEYYD